MEEILEWLDLEFKTTMTDMLRALMEKVDGMPEKMAYNNIQDF